jgi:glycosyltransferase involved in cell wall biosynthesis
MSDLKVAIDATRVKSGGGIAHLLGILALEDISVHGIQQVHIWAYQNLLDRLPNRPWLVKHCPKVTEQSLVKQIYWQAFKLADEIKRAGCQILFAVDASTFSRFKPMVVLSQNMIPFEVGFETIYGFDKSGIHQRLILQVQKRAFQFADAVIFLTNYAAKRIQLYTGPLKNYQCIAHGVDAAFKQISPQSAWPAKGKRPIQCLYVSPIWEYKHQAELVRAIKVLRERGHNVTLTLTGGGNSEGQALLEQEMQQTDPGRSFVQILDFVPHADIPKLIANADLFVFASSVETFGITLLEAMTIGMPIACSNRSSLPETLQDGGVYFDPQNEQSIAEAVEALIKDAPLRQRLAARAKQLAEPYSWQKCAAQTWGYIAKIYQNRSKRAEVVS